MNNKKRFHNIKDIFNHACIFLIRDTEEIANMQLSEFVNTEKFTIHAYKKVFNEMDAGILSIKANAKMNPLREKIAFHHFQDIVSPDFLQLAKRSKSVMDIAREISGKDTFNNTSNIDTYYFDSITNIPSFINGTRDFAMSLALQQNDKVKELYIYNPNTNEMLFYSSQDKIITINNRRGKVSNLTSKRNVKISIVSSNLENIDKVKNIFPDIKFQILSSDLPSQIINLISNKCQFLVNLSPNEQDKIYLNALTDAGYHMKYINKNFIISNTPDSSIGYIVTNRNNSSLL